MTEKQKKRCPSKLTKSSKKCCSLKTAKSTKKHCGKSIKTSGNLSLSDTVKKQGNQVAVKTAELPKGYRPSEKEEYMNDNQQKFFRKILADRVRLYEVAIAECSPLESCQTPDVAERATIEQEIATNAQRADTYKKQLEKTKAALDRIEDGTYGYCLETGNPIGLGRLLAEPDACLCIEAKEELERHNATHAPSARR